MMVGVFHMGIISERRYRICFYSEERIWVNGIEFRHNVETTAFMRIGID